jgi:hypothetical protein
LFFCAETPGRDIFFFKWFYISSRMGPSTSQCCGLPVAKKQGDMARHTHRKQKMLQVKVNGFIEWASCDKANNNEWGPLKEEKTAK